MSLYDAFADFLKKEYGVEMEKQQPPPGTVPPSPGLVFDRQRHRWINPKAGGSKIWESHARSAERSADVARQRGDSDREKFLLGIALDFRDRAKALKEAGHITGLGYVTPGSRSSTKEETK